MPRTNLEMHGVIQLMTEARHLSVHVDWATGAIALASITNPERTITTDRVNNRASIGVRCDAEFTEFEVNAVRQFGLTYSRGCDLLNMEMSYPESMAARTGHEFPILDGDGQPRAKATPSSRCHERPACGSFELTLTNEETGGQPYLPRSR
jgi:hypothetical protein